MNHFCRTLQGGWDLSPPQAEIQQRPWALSNLPARGGGVVSMASRGRGPLLAPQCPEQQVGWWPSCPAAPAGAPAPGPGAGGPPQLCFCCAQLTCPAWVPARWARRRLSRAVSRAAQMQPRAWRGEADLGVWKVSLQGSLPALDPAWGSSEASIWLTGSEQAPCPPGSGMSTQPPHQLRPSEKQEQRRLCRPRSSARSCARMGLAAPASSTYPPPVSGPAGASGRCRWPSSGGR